MKYVVAIETPIGEGLPDSIKNIEIEAPDIVTLLRKLIHTVRWRSQLPYSGKVTIAIYPKT